MAYYLSTGYKLNNHDLSGEYIIKKVIGRGASTIAYLADFKDASGRVSERILKEYYPSNLDILRDSNGVLLCAAEDLQKYQDGINRFVAGGDRQNALRERTYLKNETPLLQKIFEANNTCYLEVTPFEGKTFDNIESFTLLERLKLCLATAKLIKRYHEEGLLYLDIKPQNIFVLTNSSGDVVTDMIELIDFDSVIEKDAIVFGNSLSFTEAWAAPEQITPHGFSKISEATDVYSLGELVFWCVFGRHSTTNEHRGFSIYPFDDITDSKISHAIQNKFTKLFKNTLRSSVKNRFESIDSITLLLNEIIIELSKPIVVETSSIRPKDFFVGREKELDLLWYKINKNGIVFLHGMGGIGKSEIAKNFLWLHRNEYDNFQFWIYTNSLIDMICNEANVYISGIKRNIEESNAEYCWRKLEAIKENLPIKSLIIIDNFDIKVSDLQNDEAAVWKFISSMGCDLLITTRCEQTSSMIHIKELDDINLLHRFFTRNEHIFDEEDNHYIDAIIEGLDKHTLLVELVSKQLHASKMSPQQMFTALQRGIKNLPNDTIDFEKDGGNQRITVMAHIKNLFSLLDISTPQKLILLKLLFMPPTGVSASTFKEFFSLCNNNEINSLILNGWINQSKDNAYILTLHPLIASVALDMLFEDEELLTAFNRDIRATISADNSCLLFSTYANIYESIATTYFRYDIKTRFTAEFITQFVEWSSQFGNLKLKCEMMEFATNIYDSILPDEKFNPEREWSYDTYFSVLIDNPEVDSVFIEKICRHRRLVSRKAKYYSWTLYWAINLTKTIIAKPWSSILAILPRVIADYLIAFLSPDRYGRDIDSVSKAKSLFVRDAELLEMMISVGKIKSLWLRKVLLHFSLWERKIAIKLGHEDLDTIMGQVIAEQTSISEARVWMLSMKYDKAQVLLESIVSGKSANKQTVNLYLAYKLLCRIAVEVNDNNALIQRVHECLKIEKQLNLPHDRTLDSYYDMVNKTSNDNA